MRPSLSIRFALALLLLVACSGALVAQGLTTPPGGANQRAVVTQYLGMVSVTIDYNAPDVTSPAGEDRTGKIWGQLVPWGIAPNPFYPGFGTAENMPWRAGSNQNTTITFSHDVEIEGQALEAGTYALFMAPGESEWTIIFNKNSSAWGSFFYDPSLDALQVQVQPEKTDYFREWLTYEFDDRQLDTAQAVLHWENLRVPFRISVPNQASSLPRDHVDGAHRRRRLQLPELDPSLPMGCPTGRLSRGCGALGGLLPSRPTPPSRRSRTRPRSST